MVLTVPLTLIWLALPARAQIDITPVTSAGGVTAWLAEEPSIPFTALDLTFRGGANIEGAQNAGAVALMAGLLNEGAGDLDAQEFAAAAEELALEMRVTAGRDTVSISARFLTENRDEAVALLRQALTQPRFDEDAIERVRAQALAGLRQDAVSPNAIASRRFADLAYGDHPYARSADGTPETVAALTRDDLVAAHQGALARDRVFVGAAGDISAQALGTLLDDLLGDLPEEGAPLPGRATYDLSPGITLVPFDGPQSVIAFGHDGIARDDPDFLAAYVLNEVFGGGRFGTRLMTSLREERGLTYGVGAFLATADLGETYQGRMSTENARAAQAIELLRSEWADVAQNGISEQELSRVQTYLTGAYPLRFDGNLSIAGVLSSMQFQGFDIDYVNYRNDLIDALTVEDMARVAGDLMDADALHFVVVGQPDGLDAGAVQ
nr:pitrilysin family protein [Roseicitreum antarcticum]